MLSCIIEEPPEVFAALEERVRQLALDPGDDEDTVAVRERAQAVVAHYGREI